MGEKFVFRSGGGGVLTAARTDNHTGSGGSGSQAAGNPGQSMADASSSDAAHPTVGTGAYRLSSSGAFESLRRSQYRVANVHLRLLPAGDRGFASGLGERSSTVPPGAVDLFPERDRGREGLTLGPRPSHVGAAALG